MLTLDPLAPLAKKFATMALTMITTVLLTLLTQTVPARRCGIATSMMSTMPNVLTVKKSKPARKRQLINAGTGVLIRRKPLVAANAMAWSARLAKKLLTKILASAALYRVFAATTFVSQLLAKTQLLARKTARLIASRSGNVHPGSRQCVLRLASKRKSVPTKNLVRFQLIRHQTPGPAAASVRGWPVALVKRLTPRSAPAIRLFRFAATAFARRGKTFKCARLTVFNLVRPIGYPRRGENVSTVFSSAVSLTSTTATWIWIGRRKCGRATISVNRKLPVSLASWLIRSTANVSIRRRFAATVFAKKASSAGPVQLIALCPRSFDLL